MGILEVQGLSCGYDGKPVLEDISFSLDAGGVLVLLGPNGVGKTTLFKTILGFVPRISGRVLVDGADTRTWTRKQLARAIAYVPQSHDATFGFAVRDMVLMGRTPEIEGLHSPRAEDERIADEVMEKLGLTHLAGRDCTTLSGGELQMVLVARALAQRPRLLVMDEPCANLDLGNQALLLRRVRELAARGLAVIVTSHDPNHAFSLGADVACIAPSGLLATGPAETVLTHEMLRELYRAEVAVGTICAGDASVWTCAPVVDVERSDA